MNLRQKIAVIGVFCIGIVSVPISQQSSLVPDQNTDIQYRVCLITMLRLDSIITVSKTSDITCKQPFSNLSHSNQLTAPPQMTMSE
jgi:hypothetical protein